MKIEDCLYCGGEMEAPKGWIPDRAYCANDNCPTFGNSVAPPDHNKRAREYRALVEALEWYYYMKTR